MREYSLNKRIDDSCKLAKLFNAVLSELDTIRLLTSPSSTYSFQYSSESFYETFYQCCVTETYFHRVIENILKWKRSATLYNKKFKGSWYAYALDRRMELNNKYGGCDESDFNDDGTLRTDFSEEEVAGSSILSSWVGYNDIFLTAKPQNFDYLYRILENASIFSFTKMKRDLGWNISLSKMKPDGTIEKMTWEEEILSEAEDQHQVDSLSEMLKVVIEKIVCLIEEVESLNYTDDNKEFFSLLPGRIDKLLNLDILSETH